MDNGGARRIVPIIFILIIIAVAIAAMVSLGQSIFGGDQPEEVNQGKRSLVNTSEDRSVRMIVRGPIQADENYYSYTITVKAATRTMTTYNGYLNRQIETKEYPNNLPAYEQFVYALDRARMMDAKEFSGTQDDIRGLCATGKLIKFETLRGTSVIKSLWTTSCRNAPGSLKTEFAALKNLFRAQVPDFVKLTSKTRIE